ncbi:hypothetical protein MSG28_003680, partial [Choristoneura fumiferana]
MDLSQICLNKSTCNKFVSKIPAMLVSTFKGAPLPPMSVFTQPGCMAATRMLSFFRSMLMDLVAAFSAACNVGI